MRTPALVAGVFCLTSMRRKAARGEDVVKIAARVDWRIAAPVLVICAGACWGMIGLFSHVLSSAGLSSPQITTVRCVIVTAVLFVLLFTLDRSALKIKLRDAWLFVGTGVLSIAFYNVCFFACIEACGLSVATILLYTAPCFVVVLSAVLFKERMTRQKTVALCIAFAGCLMVVGIGSGTSALPVVGILIGLASGIGYACYSLFSRVALKRYSAPTVMFYTFLFASCALAPFAQVGDIVVAASQSGIVLAAMFALALASTLVPFACYTAGLAHMETGRASIMAFVEPMVALVIGVSVFGDVLTAENAVGVVLILAAVALLNVRLRRPARPRVVGPRKRLRLAR